MLTLGGLGTVDTLLEPGPGARLGVARTDGDVAGDLEGAVAWVLVEGGTGALRLDDETTTIDGRDDVFDRAGWSAIVGEGSTFALVGDVRATVVWRAETRTQTGSSGEHAQWEDFSFGEPSITTLPDGTFLVTLWCIQPSGSGIRFVRVRAREQSD